MPNYLVRGSTICAALLCSLFLIGCSTLPAHPSGSTEDDSGVLGKMLDDGLANAPSEFQQEVLMKFKKSGVLGESEWKEANNRRKNCFIEKGYAAEVVYVGSNAQMRVEVEGVETPAEQERRRQVDVDCYQQTSAYINEIYDYLNGGSHRYEGDAVERAVFECLVKRELIPHHTKYDEFLSDLENNEGKQFSSNGSKNGEDFSRCWAENAG